MSARTPVRGSLEWEVRYATRAVIAIILACIVTVLWVMAAWAADKIPTELQHTWCADRLHIGSRPEGNCYRFGADYITIDGTRAHGVFVIEDSDNTFRIIYNFYDVHHVLDIIKYDDYLIMRDNDGDVRYDRRR